jgi:uncharacterized repeat protein (TIGR03803 family)
MKLFHALRLWAAIAAICSFTILTQAQAYKATNHEKVLYAFTGESDGWQPDSRLIRDAKGNLYGTTFVGGNTSGNCGQPGCGVVFEVSAAGKFSVLHTFDWNDGTFPTNLIQDTRGNLYGITSEGDNSACYNGCGVIFKLTTAGDFTLLYSFTGGSDGFAPGSLIRNASSGNFYGTAENSSDGEIFELTASGELKVLYNFKGGSDGDIPNGVVQDSKGNLYGTTFQGGTYGAGTVFKLNSEKKTILHNFKGKGDGDLPPGVLIIDKTGNLYGVTSQGGYEKGNCDLPDSPVGCGTVFKITASGTFSVLFAFDNTNGNDPSGLIEGPNGNLYGNTYLGGSSSTGGNGLVFKLAAGSYKESTLYHFKGLSDGSWPYGGMVEDSNYNLYGTTLYGGDLSCAPGQGGGCGVVFEITAD